MFQRSGYTSMFEEFPTLFSPENCGNIRVVRDGDKIVSAIAFTVRPTSVYGSEVVVASLGAVCTYEEYRGRGLATHLLEDSYRVAREAGADVMLISGTRGMYERAGCVLGPMNLDYTVPAERAQRCECIGDISVRETTDDDIDDLVAVHRTEPVRFVRTERDWKGFLSVCRLVHPSLEPPLGVKRSYIVSCNGTVVAHLVLQYPGDRANGVVRITEFSGSRIAAFTAAQQLTGAFGGREIHGSLLPEDRESKALLNELEATVAYQPMGGHRVSILHTGILDRYRVWLDEQLPADVVANMSIHETDGRYALVADGCEIDAGDLLSLNGILFGDGIDSLQAPPKVVDLWRRVLPLPLALPGLNYI